MAQREAQEKDIVFDREAYAVISSAREQWLRRCIDRIPFRSELKTALDVGCGAGHFSAVLRELGFEVTGVDLRPDNIDVCRTRHPDISFDVIDLDQPFGEIGTFDLVLLFGILYHLESPLQTVQRLSQAIGRVGIVSTRVAEGDEMALYLFHEREGAANNQARVTAVPTFAALLAIFGHAGLPHLYLPSPQVDHPQWRQDFGNGRRYSIVVSREPIDEPSWQPVDAPDFHVKWEPLRRRQPTVEVTGVRAVMRKLGL
jgi:SAM-dependent methyltransferase